MKKPYKCCKCKFPLGVDDAVFADNRGTLRVNGKPYCPKCLPYNSEADYEDEPISLIEKIDRITIKGYKPSSDNKQ